MVRHNDHSINFEANEREKEKPRLIHNEFGIYINGDRVGVTPADEISELMLSIHKKEANGEPGPIHLKCVDVMHSKQVQSFS